jgi:hypothetical protein
MAAYKLSPYLKTIENRLLKGSVQSGLFHRLSGEILELTSSLRMFLLAASGQKEVNLEIAELEKQFGPDAEPVKMVRLGFLLPIDQEPLEHFLDHYVVRPLQNPAIGYRLPDGALNVVRLDLSEYLFGRKHNDLPHVIEETLSDLAASLFAAADGTNTLRQLFEQQGVLPDSNEAREAIELLTSIDRQLIKLTPVQSETTDPFKPCNIIGRDLTHAAESEMESVTDFHLRGIEDGLWEFDQIEPTINHAFRFPSEVFAGMSYGAKFCDVIVESGGPSPIDILEVGGGTGSFALGFLEELRRKGIKVNYHILDLSPVLIEHQRRVLAESGFAVTHFHQNATQFGLPDKTFDLIVSNEVIADFPVAEVRRLNKESGWEGPGYQWVELYSLQTPDEANSFLVNSGVCQFVERAWKHLKPRGRFVVTEYGGADAFPVLAFQLNHEEFSIHFGHAAQCATRVGFDCQLVPLKDFLGANDQIEVLDGRELSFPCLNHLFRAHGFPPMSYSAWTKSQFTERYQELVGKLNLVGISFSKLQGGFHFTPDLDAFMALVMNKPKTLSVT